MFASRRFAILAGVLFWGVVGGVTWLALQGSSAADPAPGARSAGPSVPRQIVNYFANRSVSLQLQLPSRVPLRKGDPIFALDPAGQWIQTGYITDSDHGEAATTAMAAWYAPAIDPAYCRFAYYHNRGRLGEVVQLMLPPEKRERIEHLIRQSIASNAPEITAAFRPIVTRSLAESVPVVERALKASIASHQEELGVLGERYRDRILTERLLPLVREEVMPSVRKHGEPVIQKIGRELWDRASLWRFGWRALYDKAPLPERGLFQDEWDRFVEEEAIPVFEKHTDELIEVQRRVLTDLSKNPVVRQELREVLQQLATDRELQALVTTILRESILENRELREVWAENWRREDARAALRLAGLRLDPVIRQIGDELFGTRETGIDPAFARVLRNQILGKDKRWIVAIPNPEQLHTGGVIPVAVATESEPFPLLILASPVEEP